MEACQIRGRAFPRAQVSTEKSYKAPIRCQYLGEGARSVLTLSELVGWVDVLGPTDNPVLCYMIMWKAIFALKHFGNLGNLQEDQREKVKGLYAG